jgi:hypothetical protein
MLSLLLISPVELTLVAVVGLPVETNSTYVQDAVFAPAPSDAIVFELHVPSRGPGREMVVVRYDPDAKRIHEMQGVYSFQEDCRLGIASLYSLQTKVTTNFEVKTGKPLSQTFSSMERVGRLAVERYEPLEKVDSNDQPRVFDVLNGRELATIGRFWSSENYIGDPAWDNGKVRLFASIPMIEGQPKDGIELHRMKPGTFERVESVLFTTYAFGFDRIVGNPSEGNFAVQYSSNRWAYHTTLTKELKKTPFQVDRVLDIDSKGVLGKMIVEQHEFGDPSLGPVGCWDPMTGQKLWQLDKPEPYKSLWLDKYALIERELRDPKTGAVVGKLPEGRMFVAARGDTFWLVTNEAPRKLEVWRVPN